MKSFTRSVVVEDRWEVEAISNEMLHSPIPFKSTSGISSFPTSEGESLGRLRRIFPQKKPGATLASKANPRSVRLLEPQLTSVDMENLPPSDPSAS
jgi:hypothetical protein